MNELQKTQAEAQSGVSVGSIPLVRLRRATPALCCLALSILFGLVPTESDGEALVQVPHGLWMIGAVFFLGISAGMILTLGSSDRWKKPNAQAHRQPPDGHGGAERKL